MRTVTGNNTVMTQRTSQEHPGQPAAGSPRSPGRSEKAPPSPPSLSLAAWEVGRKGAAIIGAEM